jgi:hypothetical protein
MADRFQIAIKNMGAYFSVNTPSLITYYYINATPQVVNNTGFLSDTINWTEIKGCFTALGGEQYITIGSFGNRASTDTINTISTNPIPTSTSNNFAYYYIDSVTLYQNNFPTNVKELGLGDGVKVYPNPTEGSLTVSIPKGEGMLSDYKFIIRDVLGKEALVENYNNEIDISALEKGIYFLSLYKNNQLIITKKVIKE